MHMLHQQNNNKRNSLDSNVLDDLFHHNHYIKKEKRRVDIYIYIYINLWRYNHFNLTFVS